MASTNEVTCKMSNGYNVCTYEPRWYKKCEKLKDDQAVPEDLFGMLVYSTDDILLMMSKYKNEDVIWAAPKGLPYPDYPGYKNEQFCTLYPDCGATYFVSRFVLPKDSTLILNGQFPHSRYCSFTLAVTLPNGDVVSGNNIQDFEIKPDKGSSNPFLNGANRNVKNRNYTLYIKQSDIPSKPEPNTLYIPNDAREQSQHLSYRVYIADYGYDCTGASKLQDKRSGLPDASLKLKDGTIVTGTKMMKMINVTKLADVPFPRSTYLEAIARSPDPVNAPVLKDLQPQVFWNTNYSLLGLFLARDQLTRIQYYPIDVIGGFAANPASVYLLGSYSFGYGEILIIRGKLPTFPRTRNGESTFTTDTQVRYFEVTVEGAPPYGNGYNGVYDEKIPVDKRGFYTIVISWPYLRPANALLSNGVVWLNHGLGEGAYVGARAHVGGFLVKFHMPNANWKNSPAKVPVPTVDNPEPQEQKVMGDYFPMISYMSKVEFEKTYKYNK